MESGRLEKKLLGHTEDVQKIFLIENDKLIISVSKFNVIKIWDMVSGNLLRTINTVASNDEKYFSISNDGEKLICHSDNSLKIIEIKEKGKILSAFVSHNDFGDIQITEDERKIISYGFSSNTIKVWDAVNAKLLFSFNDNAESIDNVLITKNKERIKW